MPHELRVEPVALRDAREAAYEAPAVLQAFLPDEPVEAAACEQPVGALASLPAELVAVVECERLASLPAVPQDDLVVRHEQPVVLAALRVEPVVQLAFLPVAPQVDSAEHRGPQAGPLDVPQDDSAAHHERPVGPLDVPQVDSAVLHELPVDPLDAPRDDSAERHERPVDRGAPQDDCRVLPERHAQAAAQFRAVRLLPDCLPELRDVRRPVLWRVP